MSATPSTPENPNRTPPIASHLWSTLLDLQREHDAEQAIPETESDAQLHDTAKLFENFALRLVQTGAIGGMEWMLADFMPESTLSRKLTALVEHPAVVHGLQFRVAHDVVRRLNGLERRVRWATAAYALLLRAEPNATAVKYLERASRLFLAGYDSEVIILCGAVVEAAVAECISDDALRAAGIKPKHSRTGGFSLAQRMKLAEDRGLLPPDIRKAFWDVVNWRNDAMHIQPDMGPSPVTALIVTAVVLGALLPRTA